MTSCSRPQRESSIICSLPSGRMTKFGARPWNGDLLRGCGPIVPLKAPTRCRGVFAVQPQNRAVLERPDNHVYWKHVLINRLSVGANSLCRCFSTYPCTHRRRAFAQLAFVGGFARPAYTPNCNPWSCRNSRKSDGPFEQVTRLRSLRLYVTDPEELQRLVTNLLDLARMQSDEKSSTSSGIHLTRSLVVLFPD